MCWGRWAWCLARLAGWKIPTIFFVAHENTSVWLVVLGIPGIILYTLS